SIGSTEILGEVTSEMLLGSGAPGFVESPLRAAIGLRHPLARHLWLNGVVEGSLAARPPSLPGDPLAPLEPRVQAMVGVTWRYLSPKKVTSVQVVVQPKARAEQKPEEKEVEAVPEALPAIITTSVRVTVIDEKNHP